MHTMANRGFLIKFKNIIYCTYALKNYYLWILTIYFYNDGCMLLNNWNNIKNK